MKLQQKQIGIWGLGVVGWSVLRYLIARRGQEQPGVPTGQLVVFEQRVLTANELVQLQNWGVTVALTLEQFLTECAVIIPSPGIDLRPYQAYQAKFFSELDLFYAGFTKPILAVTGSLGKTTVTTVVSELLSKLGYRVGVGGNIGVGMCDLIAQQADFDLAVLELSSFQLELAQQFRPHWALWTNFHPNHLDRHADLAGYFGAKLKLFAQQQTQDVGILPAELVTPELIAQLSRLAERSHSNLGVPALVTAPTDASANTDRGAQPDLAVSDTPGLAKTGHYLGGKLSCFSLDRPTRLLTAGQLVAPLQCAYYVQDQMIVREQGGVSTPLVATAQLSPQIMLINWVAIISLLDRIQAELAPALVSQLNSVLSAYQFTGIPHRLELCGELRGVKFYNDSKSTVPAATLAALNSLTAQAVILVLGGLSKGVNRESLVAQLGAFTNLKVVICFGAEAEQLQAWCVKYGLPAVVAPDLAGVLSRVWQLVASEQLRASVGGVSVLFSPAGSSFDLFQNYQARGAAFKALVQQFIHQSW